MHDTSDRNSAVHGACDMITDYAGQELQVVFPSGGTTAPSPVSDDVLVRSCRS